MNLQFHCPYCQMLIAADSSSAAANIQCPHCGNVFMVQAPVPVVQARVVAPTPQQAAPPHRAPQVPSRPGPQRPAAPGARTPSAKQKEAEGEKKAMMLVGALLVGGVLLVVGGFILISSLSSKAEKERFALPAEVVAREKAGREALKREQEEQAAREAEDREKLRKFLLKYVCEGNEKAATAMLAAIEGVGDDLEKLQTDATADNDPKDLSRYWRDELARRCKEDPVIFHWLGGRPPSLLADLLFGGESSGPAPRGKTPGFLAAGNYSASGTGFFIASDGWIMTNQHVVGDAKEVDVRGEDGEIRPARVVKTDATNDVALLKMDTPPRSWLHFSAGELPMGASVFTIGFPNATLQGVEPKFTDGRISSLTGYRDEKETYQVSVPIQSGNSGGPLVDMKAGNVVGVTSAVLRGGDNVGYAIKSRIALALVESVPEAKSSLARSPASAASDEAAMIARVKSATVLVLVR